MLSKYKYPVSQFTLVGGLCCSVLCLTVEIRAGREQRIHGNNSHCKADIQNIILKQTLSCSEYFLSQLHTIAYKRWRLLGVRLKTTDDWVQVESLAGWCLFLSRSDQDESKNRRPRNIEKYFSCWEWHNSEVLTKLFYLISTEKHWEI